MQVEFREDYRSLHYVEGFSVPVPKDLEHRQTLWTIAEHLDQPVSELALVTKATYRMDRSLPIERRRYMAGVAINDLRTDGLIKSLVNTDFAFTYSRKSRSITVTNLGLVVAAESARRIMHSARHNETKLLASRVYRSVVSYLLTAES